MKFTNEVIMQVVIDLMNEAIEKANAYVADGDRQRYVGYCEGYFDAAWAFFCDQFQIVGGGRYIAGVGDTWIMLGCNDEFYKDCRAGVEFKRETE